MIRLTGTVLDAPDAQALGDFYRRLLGWTYAADEPGWVKLDPVGHRFCLRVAEG